MTVCKILKVEGSVVTLDKIDAFDNSPVLDLKPFIPSDAPREGVREPEWVKKMRERRKTFVTRRGGAPHGNSEQTQPG